MPPIEATAAGREAVLVTAREGRNTGSHRDAGKLRYPYTAICKSNELLIIGKVMG